MKKKLYYLLFFLFAIQITNSQTPIHTLPTSVFYNAPLTDSQTNFNSVSSYYNVLGEPDELDIKANINSILDILNSSNFEDDYDGDLSKYYARRVKAHIQLYHYFDRDGDPVAMQDHLFNFEIYFNKLLGQQCIEYYNSTQNPSCSASNPYHGGFPSTVNNSSIANPLTTAIALHALLEARNFYLNIGMGNMDISCEELEDRIRQAKSALYEYPEFNNQYFNLTAFAFIAASNYDDFYNDLESRDFLTAKGSELMYGLHPLRTTAPTPSDTPWSYGPWPSTLSWQEEGYQVDGSWRDFGRDVPLPESPRTYNLYERWHDSELDYHSAMIEGLAKLYSSLADGPLKTETKEKLIGSINHIIDYNGHETSIENSSFDPNVIGNDEELNTPGFQGNPIAFEQSRLAWGGQVGKYHRETTLADYPTDPMHRHYLNANLISKRAVGIGFLRSLIIAKDALNLPPAGVGEEETLDLIIKVLTIVIIKSVNLPEEQLYDLSLYLNRKHLNDNRILASPRENDKLIVSFDDKVISAFHNDICIDLQSIEDFYKGSQTVQEMVTGDFNGDGKDELIVAFTEAKGIYRFQENATGNLEITERFYSGDQLTLALEAGDFNGGGGKEQLIVALDNGEIRKYEEDDVSGNMVQVEIFHFNNTHITTDIIAMKAVNFDGTGKDQLVVAFDNSDIKKYEEISGNMTPQLHGILHQAGTLVTVLESGNFNNDNKEELILVYDNSIVQRYKEDPSASLQTIENSAPQAIKVTTGDYNNDDKDELIISFDNGKIFRYQENTAGILATSPSELIYDGQLTQALATGDFDKDINGIEELIVSFSGAFIYKYEENTAGNLQITERVYDDGEYTNKMVVLKKGLSTTGRANNTAQSIPQIERDITIKAYPNPVTNYLKISGIEAHTDYLLYSIEGRLISKGTIENDKKIDFSNIQKGLYFLKINANTTFKIIKN